MKPKLVSINHELLCEAIGHLEEYADSQHNGGYDLNLQVERDIRRVIKKLDKQRMAEQCT